MKNIAEKFREFLITSSGFNSVMNNKVYPLFALSDVQVPYSVYQIRRSVKSVDSDGFDIMLFCFFAPDKITELMEFESVVVNLVKGSNHYELESSETDYSDDTGQMVLIVNLKKL